MEGAQRHFTILCINHNTLLYNLFRKKHTSGGIRTITTNNHPHSRIVEPSGENEIPYILGLPSPLPGASPRALSDNQRYRHLYLDWELRNWREFYHEEFDVALGFPWKGTYYKLPQVLIYDNITRPLPLSKIYVQPLESLFVPPRDVRELTEPFFKALWNSSFEEEINVRLTDIIHEGDGINLVVQPVGYRYFVHTNLVLDARKSKSAPSLREHIHVNGLEPISKSPLANNLGINILLFTSEGDMIIQKRSQKVAFRRGELCPAGSGTVSSKDVPRQTTLADMPLLREAQEEIGIQPGDVIKNEILFLGISRELIRGGEPELFFAAPTRLTKKELLNKRTNAGDAWESDEDLVFWSFGEFAKEPLDSENKVKKLLSLVDECMATYQSTASIPLLTVIALWIKHKTYPYHL